MARSRNLQNLKTEKEGIAILRELEPKFYVPTAEERKILYDTLDIDYAKYNRSVDGLILKVSNIKQVKSAKDVLLVEIKTTRAKNIKELPYGVFFGITKNEEDLFRSRENFRLCIVHTIMKEFALVNFEEYENLIQNKRIQFQVNFKNKV